MPTTEYCLLQELPKAKLTKRRWCLTATQILTAVGLAAVWLATLSGCANQKTAAPTAMLSRASNSVVAVGHNGSTIGSAFTLQPNQYVTSLHVAAQSPIYLIAAGGKPTAAKIIAKDEQRDIAVLSANLSLPALSPRADLPLVGTRVYALGNPFGLGLTATQGIISAHPRSIGKQHLLQIDAAINPGNSGGPLVDANGQVVGLVSSRAAIGSGIGFVVPIEFVLSLANANR